MEAAAQHTPSVNGIERSCERHDRVTSRGRLHAVRDRGHASRRPCQVLVLVPHVQPDDARRGGFDVEDGSTLVEQNGRLESERANDLCELVGCHRLCRKVCGSDRLFATNDVTGIGRCERRPECRAKREPILECVARMSLAEEDNASGRNDHGCRHEQHHPWPSDPADEPSDVRTRAVTFSRGGERTAVSGCGVTL